MTLGKDPRLASARPPKSPPQSVLDRHRQFEELEYRAKHGLPAGPVREKSLSVYCEDYIAAYAKTHKNSSLYGCRSRVERFLAWCSERKISTLQAVTRPVCRDYLEFRAGTVAHDTLRVDIGYLSPIWSRAVDDGLIAVNPWHKIKAPGKSARKEPTYWSPEDITRIVVCCRLQWLADLVLVLANTGLRISTALEMRWGWIDWDRGVITIPREEAATRSGVKTSYAVALNRVSRDVLQRRSFHGPTTANAPVFPRPGKPDEPARYDSAAHAIGRAIKRAGVKLGTCHSFRHSYARILSQTQPANVVQSLLGHSSQSTTRIYTDLRAEDVAKQLEDFGVGDGHR